MACYERPQPFLDSSTVGGVGRRDQRKQLLADPQDAPSTHGPLFDIGQVIDNNALELELKRLNTTIGILQHRPSPIIYSTRAGVEELRQIGRRQTQLEDYNKRQAANLGEYTTYQDLYPQAVLQAAGLILLNEARQAHIDFHKARGTVESLLHALETVAVNTFTTTQSTLVKFGEVSLMGMLGEKAVPPSLAAFYTFFMDGLLTRFEQRHDERLAHNQFNPYAKKYPNFMKVHIQDASYHVGVLMDTTPQQMDELVQNCSGIDREVAARAKKMVGIVQGYRKKLAEALKNPKSREFGNVAPLVRDHLAQGGTPVTLALHLIGLHNTDAVKNFYRDIEKVHRAGAGNDLYPLLMESINSMLEEAPERFGLLPSDADEVLFDQRRYTQSIDPIFSDIVAAVTDLYRQGMSNYEVDIPSLELAGLATPTKADIEFTSPNPYEMKICLEFDDGMGENMTLRYELEAKQRRFDWNVLNSPTSKPDFRAACILTAQSIVRHIHKEAITPAAPTVAVWRAPRQRAEKLPWKNMKKASKPKVEVPLPPQPNTTAEVKRVLHIDRKVADALRATLSSEDYARFMAGVDNYIEHGLGRAKRLTALQTDAKHIGLRIGDDMRAVFEDRDGTKGEQHLWLKGGGYRKDIFRKLLI